MDPNKSPYHVEALREELARRCEANPRYSLRAFAKGLQLQPSTLSRVLAGKRGLTARTAQQLLRTLDLAPEDQKKFIYSALEHRSASLAKLKDSFSAASADVKAKELSLDLFRIISDWYHYAILELTFTEGFKSDTRSIARKLGISQTEAQLAIERLIELGLLTRKDGRLAKTDEQLTTADKNLTTAGHRKYQRQILEKAIRSLENDPIEERSVTSMTMAIDPAKLPTAKKMIEEFTQKLCVYLESGKRKQVYQMGINLYPLQKREQK